MQIIPFKDSEFNRLRAQLHEIPYKANNALIERLKFSVGPAVAKKVHDVLNELPNRKEISITDRLDTAQLKKGDIVRIILKPSNTPKLGVLTLSVKNRMGRTPLSSIVSAYVFSQNEINSPLSQHSEVRLPPTLHSRVDRSGGKRSSMPPTPTTNKIGKLEIPISDIQAISLHQTPITQGVVNQLKRGFNQFLDLFKAQTIIINTMGDGVKNP